MVNFTPLGTTQKDSSVPLFSCLSPKKCVSLHLNELGTGNLQSRPRPQVVSVGEKIVDVAVGSEHTVAVTASGAVFAWGSNELGQLGQSSGASAQSTTPLRVRFFRHPSYFVLIISALAKKTIVGVSCGYEHVIVLSSILSAD